ncbi:hypothetical protein HDU93_004058 [Gonapodya sp. JEL0774]|nr:hypothetical protein HDU93_004058 [Gonapodya sp. JEL0774]
MQHLAGDVKIPTAFEFLRLFAHLASIREYDGPPEDLNPLDCHFDDTFLAAVRILDFLIFHHRSLDFQNSTLAACVLGVAYKLSGKILFPFCLTVQCIDVFSQDDLLETVTGMSKAHLADVMIWYEEEIEPLLNECTGLALRAADDSPMHDNHDQIILEVQTDNTVDLNALVSFG